MALINVILTGGVGSRLWPLSRKSRPKQYIPLFNGATLFRLCAERNKDICDGLIVVGNVDNYRLSKSNLEQSGIDHYMEVIEAMPRNTAAAIAFAAFSLKADDIMLVTPSDHIISGNEAYQRAVTEAARLAHQGNLVTFGIRPAHPETGYGYIEHDGEQVIAFTEKPSLQAAMQYITSGKHLWNSGIFCFKAGVFMEELMKFEPGIYHASLKVWEERKGTRLDEDLSALIPSKSVDYAVMERSDKIKVVPADFTWSDLGSYDALWSYMEQSGLATGNNFSLGTQKHVEFIGVENIVYVETEDAVLILDRSCSQDVKKVYEQLEKELPQLLS